VRLIRKFALDRRGATLIEYGLVMALMFLVMMVAVHAMADEVISTWSLVATKVVNAGGA